MSTCVKVRKKVGRSAMEALQDLGDFDFRLQHAGSKCHARPRQPEGEGDGEREEGAKQEADKEGQREERARKTSRDRVYHLEGESVEARKSEGGRERVARAVRGCDDGWGDDLVQFSASGFRLHL